jgi:hypothetical protein
VGSGGRGAASRGMEVEKRPHPGGKRRLPRRKQRRARRKRFHCGRKRFPSAWKQEHTGLKRRQVGSKVASPGAKVAPADAKAAEARTKVGAARRKGCALPAGLGSRIQPCPTRAPPGESKWDAKESSPEAREAGVERARVHRDEDRARVHRDEDRAAPVPTQEGQTLRHRYTARHLDAHSPGSSLRSRGSP